jgi:DNA replication and repair protein RecF
MFLLQSLHFEHFKNYANESLTLCPQVNCFVGKNGAGKTNLLDAIYYLSFTKSFFSGSDQQHINQNGASYFFIEGMIQRNSLSEKVRIAVLKGAKKTVHVNHNEHPKLIDHIGLYPLVMIAPNDILLILEGSEERRKFLDGFIAQCDKVYLKQLLAYNRILDQRNRQLKIFAEQRQVDIQLLQTYNEQLIQYGTFLFLKRKEFMGKFIPVFRQLYQTISGGSEQVDVGYESDLLENTFNHLLTQYEQSDLFAQRTTKGIHKDELAFTLNGQPLKKFGSQGQQKSFIISLKLAQYAYLKQQTDTKPILLLDDIFEKLDEHRLQTLLGMIAHGDFGQIFITDTHLQRLRDVFETMPQVPVKYFTVENGSINEI